MQFALLIRERARGAWCGAAQVDTLLKQLTVAWNDSNEHIMAGTLKGVRAAVTSVRIRQRMRIVVRMVVREGKGKGGDGGGAE